MQESQNCVSAVYLLQQDGSVLLQLRDDKPGVRRPGHWVVPGGHCNPGETLEACASREFEEETGYRCLFLRFLLSLDDEVDDYRYRLHVFWTIYDGQQPITCLEGQALRFVKREEAGEYLKVNYLIHYWDLVLEKMNQELVKTRSLDYQRGPKP